MGLLGTGFLEFRKEREQTNYPFSSRASLANRDGATIVQGTLLDLCLHPYGGREGAYLSRVDIDSGSCTLVFGDAGSTARCSATFSLVSPPDVVEVVDGHGTPAGVIVSETARLAGFQAWAVGSHAFDPPQTELCAGCVLPEPEPGLRGFLLDNGDIVAGDVVLLGDDGVVLSFENASEDPCEDGGQVLRVDVVGDPLFKRRVCGPEDNFTTPRLVKSIKVEHPDGEFTIQPDGYGFVQVSVLNARTTNTALVIQPDGSRLDFKIQGSRG